MFGHFAVGWAPGLVEPNQAEPKTGEVPVVWPSKFVRRSGIQSGDPFALVAIDGLNMLPKKGHERPGEKTVQAVIGHSLKAASGFMFPPHTGVKIADGVFNSPLHRQIVAEVEMQGVVVF